MTAHTKLLLLKTTHTIIWGFFVTAISYVLYSGITDHLTICTWVAAGLVAGEGLVLLLFENQCPLTLLARTYSASRAANFDIFLPNWLAHYNKLIFTVLYLAALLLVGYRLLV